MHVERDLIQTKLSPDLNEDAYYKRVEGIQFQDLRWGIDTDLEDEIENDKKVLEVCLDEIQNNRPYFCVLLGDRYGWIPENDLVKATGRRYGIYDEDEDVDKSITHLEIDYGFLKNPEFRDHSFAYFRNIKGDVTGTIYESDPAEKARMEALKREIRKALPAENVHEYDVEYKNGKLIGVEKFIDLAREDMARVVLDGQLSEDDLSDNEKEIIYHKTQANEKSVISNARKSVEDAVIANIEDENIITIKGESGNGKSTLMAKISKRLENDYNSLILFSSLTPRTTTATGIMRIITEYITDSLTEDDLALSGEALDKAIEDFNNEQESLASNSRANNRSKEEELYEQALREYFVKGTDDIIILIDAIDQLDNPRAVEALLKPINFTNKSKIKFIISYLEEEEHEDDFVFLNDYQNYKLEELDYDDRLEVINSSLKANNKELPHSVKEEIIHKEGSKSPLYVALLVQRLVMMNIEDYTNIINAGDNYHTITRYQKELIGAMPNDLKDLIIELISQAAINLDTNTEDVYKTIDYLGVSRRGLRETDLKRIYELKGVNYNALDFATLKKYLRAFFLEDRYLRTDFTHKIIRHAILENISEAESRSLHNDIANAFMTLPIEDPIKLQEQYYSAFKAQNAPAALELLLSLGKNASKLSIKDIQIAIESITKIHNLKLNSNNDDWLKELFDGFNEMSLEDLKELLAYFVYGAYEEKTNESIEATIHNQEILLRYIENLMKENPHDYELMRIYADHLAYLGVKLTSGTNKAWTKAENYLQFAVNLNELIYDIDKTAANRESLGNAYGNLARYYTEQGIASNDKARKFYQKSLDIFQDIASENPTMVNQENLAMAYNNLANTYAAGSYDDIILAKAYYFKTIDIINELLEEYDSISLKKTLAMGYINIATLYFGEDEYEQAEEWYNKSVVIIKDIEAREPSLANKETLGRVYNNIADLFASELIDDKENAEQYYKKAIQIFESILRHKPILSAKKSLSTTYDNIGNLYADWKEEKAYDYYKKAIAIKEELITAESPREEVTDLATSYNNLAFLYVDNRTELEKAAEYYKKSADILLKIKPDQIDKKYGEDLAVVYTNLGALYFILADLDQSDNYYNKAIEIHQELIDTYHDDDNIEKLLIIYENLAVSKADLDYSIEEIEGDYLKAIDLIKIMQDPYKKVKKTAITYGNLGNLYLIKDGNFELAEDCYKKSAYLTQKVVDFHESVENLERLAVIYYNLAGLYEIWGKEQEKILAQAKVDVLAKEINYEENDDNINKFIHLHDLTK